MPPPVDPNSLELTAPKTQEIVTLAVNDAKLSSKFQEKHFGRPPFSFLQRSILAMINSSGFGEGLFNDAEKGTIEDKEVKLTFLRKIVDLTGFVYGSIPINVEKVLAGKEEAEMNYKFLQLLSYCCINKVNSSELVKKVLSGEKPGDKPYEGGSGGGGGESKSESKTEPKPKPAAEAKHSEPKPSAGGLPVDPSSLELTAPKTQEIVTLAVNDAKLSSKFQEKHFGRPPFSFLQRSILAMINSSGFGEGLFNDAEKGTIEDKEVKLTFLRKIVDLTGFVYGSIPINVEKVLAGKEEAEMNYKFLQLLSYCCINKVNSSELVKKVLSGEKPGDKPYGGGGGSSAAAPSASASESKSEAKTEPKRKSVVESKPPQPSAAPPSGGVLPPVDPSSLELTAPKTQEIVTLAVNDAKLSSKFQEKHFGRPPFSFLQRSILAMINSSGFGEGLFNDAEKGTIEDKEVKLTFLRKIVDLTGFVYGSIPINVEKVLAGKEEAEMNYKFLQLLSYCCINKVNSSELVKKVLSGEKPGDKPYQGSSSGGSSSSAPVPSQESKTESKHSEPVIPSKPSQPSQPKENLPDISNLELTAEKTKLLVDEAVANPKLSSKFQEKHFGRPPYSFLNKVFENIIEHSNYGKGLYTAEEGKSEDKEEKAKYLTKMLTLVSMTYHIQFEWNVIKVIAGKEEPENNYKFLQSLALAAINHVDSSNIIQRMENGDTAIIPPEPVDLPSQQQQQSSNNNNNNNPFDQNRNSNPPPTIENEQKIQNNNNDEEMGPRIIPRPSSKTYKRPPKVYDNISNDNGRGDGSLPAGLIIEDEESDDEDNNNNNNNNNNNMIGGGQVTVIDKSEVHTKFAKDVLDETKKESKLDDKDGNNNNNADGSNNNNDSGGIKLKHRKNNKGNSVAGVLQVDTLRDNVQKICQSTAPLGKCMDFILDDLENMKRELLQWNEEYKRSKISLEEAKKKSEELLKPIQSKITDIDEQIKEQKQKILSQKAIITKNEARINDLLRMASKTTH